jgi:predicted permease
MFRRKKRSTDDFRQEIQSHLELEADEHRANGKKDDAARAQALRAFGNVTRTEEHFYEHGRALWFDDLARDLRYGFSTMRRNPGFAAAALLTLTLGIGVNTTIFSFVNALLLRPLPVTDSERLVAIYTTDFSGPRLGTSSYPDYLDFARSNALSGVTAYSMQPMSVNFGGSTERLLGHFVTDSYFSVLGLNYMPPGNTAVLGESDVIISRSLWQRNFASDPAVAGRAVLVNGRPYRIAGVAPSGFTGLVRGVPADLWVPISAVPGTPEANRLANRGSRWLFVVGRLADGVNSAKAQAALDVIAGQLYKTHQQDWVDLKGKGRQIRLLPTNESLLVDRTQVVAFLSLLMSVVGIVLLLACVNVANLLLARSAARAREISIRLSLGAGRERLIRQMLTESLLLSCIAGTAGVLAAVQATRLLMRFRPPLPVTVELDLSVDFRVLGFAFAISLLTALVFGLLPAFRSTRLDLTSALKQPNPEAGGSRLLNLRNTLTAAQVALSLLLLIGAGLFIQSLVTAASMDIGFDPRNTVVASVNLPRERYSEERGAAFYDELVRKMDALPGVRSTSLAERIPLGFGGQRTVVRIEGYTPQQGEDMELNFNIVAPRYFETMRIMLVQGREFTGQDTKGAPGAVIVNEALARRYWPGQNPLGKRMRRGSMELAVIGVARDGKYRSLSEQPLPFFYLSLAQYYRDGMSVHVQAHGDPAAMINAIRRTVQSMDNDLPLFDVKTMKEHLGLALLPSRVAAWLLGLFGALALVLALVGIYGVTSYAVSRRTREVGIRMALGARMTDVLAMILRQGMTVVLIGLLFGVGAAISLTRFATSLLYGVSPTDPRTFAGVALLLAAGGLAATFAPAVRAARIQPVNALRHE